MCPIHPRYMYVQSCLRVGYLCIAFSRFAKRSDFVNAIIMPRIHITLRYVAVHVCGVNGHIEFANRVLDVFLCVLCTACSGGSRF